MKNFFIYQNGQQLGPLSLDEIRLMAREGRIAADAFMWSQGMPDWVAAEQVLANLGVSEQKAPSPSLPKMPVKAAAPSPALSPSLATSTFSGSFKVRYTPARPLSEHSNSLKLTGTGEIVFAADGIHLLGKKNRTLRFSQKIDFCIQPQQVLNLVREGKLLRFGIAVPKGKNLLMQFWAEDEATARKIQQVLPTNHTPEFAALRAETADFQDRLKAVGGASWITSTLIAINILVFIACALSGGGVISPNPQVLMNWGTNFGPLTMNGQWWRLFTAMFLHFGLLHLAFNMWALYTGGRLVEKLYGSASYVLLYLGAGLCGSFASVLWNPIVNSAGASGAIMGVYGAMLAFFLRKDTLVPASIVAQQRNSVLVFAGYNLIFGVSHQGIDNAAHIGGFLGGLVLGLSMIRPLDVERRATSGIRHWALGAVVAFALLGPLSYALAHPGTARKQELQMRSDIDWVGKQEIVVGQLLNDGLQQYKAGKINDSQFANLIEHDVLPRWDEIQQRIANDQLPAGSKLQAARSALIDYCDSRHEALKLLDTYLHSGNADDLKQSNVKTENAKTALKTFLDLYKKAK